MRNHLELSAYGTIVFFEISFACSYINSFWLLGGGNREFFPHSVYFRDKDEGKKMKNSYKDRLLRSICSEAIVLIFYLLLPVEVSF